MIQEPFLIMKARQVAVFGPTGSITEWDTFSSHATRDERDKALDQIQAAHPEWHLRPDIYQPIIARY